VEENLDIAKLSCLGHFLVAFRNKVDDVQCHFMLNLRQALKQISIIFKPTWDCFVLRPKQNICWFSVTFSENEEGRGDLF